jgi:hypothetical protein
MHQLMRAANVLTRLTAAFALSSKTAEIYRERLLFNLTATLSVLSTMNMAKPSPEFKTRVVLPYDSNLKTFNDSSQDGR